MYEYRNSVLSANLWCDNIVKISSNHPEMGDPVLCWACIQNDITYFCPCCISCSILCHLSWIHDSYLQYWTLSVFHLYFFPSCICSTRFLHQLAIMLLGNMHQWTKPVLGPLRARWNTYFFLQIIKFVNFLFIHCFALTLACRNIHIFGLWIPIG